MRKYILTILILMLLGLAFVMMKDLFSNEETKSNPYSYELGEFKKIDSTMFCYGETQRFSIELEKLRCISIDDKDNIYLGGKDRIIILNPDLSLKKSFESTGENYAISVGDDGQIFISKKSFVEVRNPAMEKTDSLKSYNDRSFITSIAVTNDFVFLADAGNKSLLKFNKKGEFVQEIGKRNREKGVKGFFIPSPYFDVVKGKHGEVWAVNSGYHQFESYNRDGEMFSSWQRRSMEWDGFSGCCNPTHISILSDASFVTSEKGLVRIKIHSPDGDLKCVVAGPDEFPEGVTGIDLAVDSNDRIFALVPMTSELRIYDKKQ